jgi:hypothetical protein
VNARRGGGRGRYCSECRVQGVGRSWCRVNVYRRPGRTHLVRNTSGSGCDETPDSLAATAIYRNQDGSPMPCSTRAQNQDDDGQEPPAQPRRRSDWVELIARSDRSSERWNRRIVSCSPLGWL